MAHPRFPLARAHKRVVYTGGNITLDQTAITAVHASALDITLEAQVGDQIEYNLNGLIGNAAQYVGFDVYTIVSSTRVTPFGPGLTASISGAGGVSGWWCSNVAQELTITGPVLGPPLVSGDLENGQVLMRVYYAKVNTTARTLNATANAPLTVWARNLGPADD